MSRPAAAIFDLDGTLLDTLDAIAAAANHTLQQHGRPARPARDFLPVVGYGLTHLLTETIGPLDEPALEAARATFTRYYAAHEADLIRIYPGIEALLEAMTDAGLRLGVLSNKPDEPTRRNIAMYFPRFRFDQVRGQRDQMPVKPDPAPALAMAHDWGLPPGSVLLVGDSEVDMQTATRAGMVPIGVSWGFRAPSLLQEHGAQLVIDHPQDLIPHLR